MGRYLHGYMKRGQLYHPDYRVVSLYVDRPSGRDVHRALADQFGLRIYPSVADFNFAGRVKGTSKPASTLFYLPAPPGANYFSALADNIEKLFKTGHPPYPIERTLLTTGILSFAMESRFRASRRLATPQLDVRYQAPPIPASGGVGCRIRCRS